MSREISSWNLIPSTLEKSLRISITTQSVLNGTWHKLKFYFYSVGNQWNIKTVHFSASHCKLRTVSLIFPKRHTRNTQYYPHNKRNRKNFVLTQNPKSVTAFSLIASLKISVIKHIILEVGTREILRNTIQFKIEGHNNKVNGLVTFMSIQQGQL